MGIMKYRMKQTVAVILAAVMAAGLCGCGGEKDTAKEDDGKHYFNVTYLDQLPDNFKRMKVAGFQGDCLYYTAYDDKYAQQGLYSYNLVEQSKATIWQGIYETTEDGIDAYSSNIQNFSVDADGNVYTYVSFCKLNEESVNQKDYTGATLDDVLEYMVSEWGYSENEAAAEWASNYQEDYTDEDGNTDYRGFLRLAGITYNYTSAIQKLDENGDVVLEISIDDEDSDDFYSNCSGIAADKDGNIYCCMYRWKADGTQDRFYVDVYGTDGTKKETLDLDDDVYNLIVLSDGRVGYVSYGDEAALEVIDPDTMSISENFAVASENISPYDGSTILVNDSASLLLYNLEDQSKEELFTWMDCNISGTSVSGFGMLSDGSLGVLLQTGASSGIHTEIAVLHEVDESDVVQTKEIRVACMLQDSELEQLAVEYNKKHEDYHISIMQYCDDTLDDWDEKINSFTTAVTVDTDIDIVVFNDYSQVINYASKGLMTDMYPLIANDSELSTEDFFPNVLAACEFDGELLGLPKSFSLTTLIGKAEDVGTEPGWTIDDAKALLSSKPEGTQLSWGWTKEGMLQTLMNLNYQDFVDPVSVACSFDTQEFVDLLEFVNLFPEEITESSNMEEVADLIHSGNVLLMDYYFNDFYQLNLYEKIFGDTLTFVGYPTLEGNGTFIRLSNFYGITKNCEEPEAAWDFLRQLYLPDEDEDEDTVNNGFSIRKDAFEKYCVDAMQELSFTGSVYLGSFSVEMQPATQEQVDQIKDLVYNTTAVYGAVSSDVLNLITEEAAYYFSGVQTAEEVASKIQDRMEIYLSETQ
jgi:ABC-type glycerol-3-phosphate transport system substrate-binding protein